VPGEVVDQLEIVHTLSKKDNNDERSNTSLGIKVVLNADDLENGLDRIQDNVQSFHYSPFRHKLEKVSRSF